MPGFSTGFSTDGTGEKLLPFPSGGGSTTDTDDQGAVEVPYDNGGSGLASTDVQNALDELAAQIAGISDGSGASSGGGDLVFIEKQTPTGTATVTFSSIPQTYSHLLVIILCRTTAASTGVAARMRFNNDSGGNYHQHGYQLQSASSGNINAAAGTSFDAAIAPGSSAPANYMGRGRIEIYDYADATKFKQAQVNRTSMGASSVGTSWFTTMSGSEWLSTAAIERLDVILDSGNYDTGSAVYLYGIN